MQNTIQIWKIKRDKNTIKGFYIFNTYKHMWNIISKGGTVLSDAKYKLWCSKNTEPATKRFSQLHDHFRLVLTL